MPLKVGISTHALTWRATFDLLRAEEAAEISTHALTWRATFSQSKDPSSSNNFYPRPHMEGDARPQRRNRRTGNFYPRPHMEGDLTPPILFAPHLGISTHALTWRATLYQYQCMSAQFISTHALTWRATRQNDGSIRISQFLPTPSHGGRPQIRHRCETPRSLFLPTPSHGGRPDAEA